ANGPGKWLTDLCQAEILTCSGPMEGNPDVGTEVAEVMLICPVIWFMLFNPALLATMDTLMFMLLLYMLVFACCPKCGGDCCENMLQDKSKYILILETYLFPPILPCPHPFISVED
uniref:Uncharacterized protein n=1 Tax=Pseudonaja textilis TaxID=8673 RepID=A0A670Y261_PSETE